MPEQREEDHRPWGYYKVLDDSSDCKVKMNSCLSWKKAEPAAP